VYVFVRKDLSPAQIAVQSCHGIIESCKLFNYDSMPHPSVIIFESKNDIKLAQVSKHLINERIEHIHFFEPDMGGQLTSIVTCPIFGEDRKKLSKYQLLGSKN
jgi:hypothetical protein